MNENLKDLFARLSAPFQPQDIEWRAGATNSDKTKALALAYITSRAVMDRLDEVMGPENWCDYYKAGPDGGVMCGLALNINGTWITKWDGAENTDFEAVKGGLSDAFKRAGYKWGIGRYLYKLDSVWVPCEAHGKSISLKTTPTLPAWALPDEWVTSHGSKAPRTSSNKSVEEREQDILKELGFAPKPAQDSKPAPKPEPEIKPIPEMAAVPTNGNGHHNGSGNGNGNGSHPKPTVEERPTQSEAQPQAKRSLSWGMNQVVCLLKNKLAANPPEAVRMLNESGLPHNATPEQILAHIKS